MSCHANLLLLQAHADNCPNALRSCKHCQEKMPAFKVLFVDCNVRLSAVLQ